MSLATLVSAFSLIPSHDHKRILFWVNNLRSDNCVLVLQAVRSSNFSSFVCPGMVWLKGQQQCFIVWRTLLADDDIKIIAIFRLYNLDAWIDATQQSSVEPLLHQAPSVAVSPCAEIVLRPWQTST